MFVLLISFSHDDISLASIKKLSATNTHISFQQCRICFNTFVGQPLISFLETAVFSAEFTAQLQSKSLYEWSGQPRDLDAIVLRFTSNHSWFFYLYDSIFKAFLSMVVGDWWFPVKLRLKKKNKNKQYNSYTNRGTLGLGSRKRGIGTIKPISN